MFATEYVHIDMTREAEAMLGGGGVGSDIEELSAAALTKKAEAANGCCACCRLTKAAAPVVIIIKLLCVVVWGVATYYGIMSVEELFASVATTIDPPTTSRAYIG